MKIIPLTDRYCMHYYEITSRFRMFDRKTGKKMFYLETKTTAESRILYKIMRQYEEARE